MTETPQAGNPADLFRLDGRTHLVLGAGSGIGAEVSASIVALGGQVLCLDTNEEAVTEVAGRLHMPHLVADATTKDGIAAAQAAVRSEFGELDGVVDIIGRMLPAEISDYGLEQWDADFDINLKHAILAGSRLAPQLPDGASMVFVSSVAGSHGSLVSPGYGPTKAALEVWVKQLAARYGRRGIRVNAVAPGLFLSPRMSARLDRDPAAAKLAERPLLGRFGRPEEVAATIAFLLSSAAGYITASTIPVEGGGLSQDSTGLDSMNSMRLNRS